MLPAASFVVLVAGLRAADTIVIPFLVAVFVSILSLPFLFWMQSRGVPRVVAVVTTIMAATGVLVGAGFLLGGAVSEFATQLPDYREGLGESMRRVVEWLQARGLEVETTDLLDPAAIVDLAQATMGRLAQVLQETVLVVLITIFILFEAAYFPAKLRAAMGEGVITDFGHMTGEVQRYLVVKTVLSLIVGLSAGIWVAILGLDYPVFWGVLAFLMHYIPNIGAFLASIPVVLLALVQYGPGRALLVVAGYAVINTVLGNLVEPPLMGRRFGLSTLVVFLSLIFWGWVWGPVGMFLSVPLTIIIRIMLESSEDWHWLAVLLGPSAPESANEEGGDALQTSH